MCYDKVFDQMQFEIGERDKYFFTVSKREKREGSSYVMGNDRQIY